jgi:hypothetical protein
MSPTNGDGRSDDDLVAEVTAWLDSLHLGGTVDDQLAVWVAKLVADFELYDRIPACWAAHPAMIAELTVCWLLQCFIESDGVDDPIAAAPRRAEWHEFLGRTLDRLSFTPGAQCARRGEHRPARSWDRHASALARQRSRQQANKPSGSAADAE